MTQEKIKKIIKMISNNTPTDKILSTLRISREELYGYLAEIKRMGYVLCKEENYYFETDPMKLTVPSKNVFDLNVGSKYLKALVISDTHLGSIEDRVDIIDNLFEYCAKNSIRYIFHCGDFINGVKHDNIFRSKHKTNIEEIQYALKEYPYDKDIKTLLVLGNHDAVPLKKDAIDIRKFITRNRKDIICLGYRFARIMMSGESIALYHPFKGRTPSQNEAYVKNICSDTNSKLPRIMFVGHTHSQAIHEGFEFPIINLPPLYNDGKNKRGAFEVVFNFNKDKIDSIILFPLSIDKKIVRQTEIFNKTNKTKKIQ